MYIRHAAILFSSIVSFPTAEVSNVIEAGNKAVFSFRFSRVHNSPEGKVLTYNHRLEQI
jgi:hypothetical protein